MLRRKPLIVFTCLVAARLGAQTFYLMSEVTNGVAYGPPYPANPCATCPLYSQGNSVYWVDNRNLTLSSSSMMTSDSYDINPPSDGSDTNGSSTNYSPNTFEPDNSFMTNGSLWIEAWSNDTQNIYLQLHNTTNSLQYQIWSATNVASASTNWTPGQIQQGAGGTNVTRFPQSIPMTNVQTFFLGQQAATVISVARVSDAYETNSIIGTQETPGHVEFSEETPPLSDPLTIYYSLSGSGRNGIDYTNLSGVATIPGSQSSVDVYVQPIDPSTLTNPIETVVFTTLPSTNYLVDPNQNSATVLIKSSSTTISIFQGPDAIRPVAPGQPEQDGAFTLSRSDDLGHYPALDIEYQISGTASNGIDYQLLIGSVTLAEGAPSTNVYVIPLAENPPQGIKTVTLTLISTNGYIADSNNYTQTINIYDQTNLVGISDVEPAINENGPPGAPVQDGSFTLSRMEPHNFLPPVTVAYSMGGEAVNGADYSNLTGNVTFDQDVTSVTIPIDPISNWTNASKTVVMTLLPGSGYYVDTNNVVGVPIATNFIDNSSTEVSVTVAQNATEPQGTNTAQPGFFEVQRNDLRGYSPALTVQYQLTGSATNGTDYTNLSGVITFDAGQEQTNVYVQPLLNTNYPGDKTVVLSLVPETDYYIDTNNASATMVILDNNILFQTVTNFLTNSVNCQPNGVDYNPYFTNLIFSVPGGFGGFGGFGGTGYDFMSLGTNVTLAGGHTVTNLTLTNWSKITGLADEVYMSVVTNSAAGFTNGDMFFGSDTGIGWLSSNATASNLTWCVLTNPLVTNPLLLRGGLCMDPTGAFSNNLVAVTSDGDYNESLKGVWEVNARGNPRLLTQIPAELLEGVTVLGTNFGPWSQQIITGDEGTGFLYTIDTNGIVTTNDSTLIFPNGIRSESIHVIPPNQNLYMCDYNGGLIAKLSKDYLTNYVGDLLIEEGEFPPGKLFIIHWDAASTNFTTRRIRYNYGSSSLEGCVFSPVEFPAK